MAQRAPRSPVVFALRWKPAIGRDIWPKPASYDNHRLGTNPQNKCTTGKRMMQQDAVKRAAQLIRASPRCGKARLPPLGLKTGGYRLAFIRCEMSARIP